MVDLSRKEGSGKIKDQHTKLEEEKIERAHREPVALNATL